MLDDGSDCLDWKRIVRGKGIGNVVLVGDAHLRLARADQGLCGIVCRLDDRDIETFIGKPALLLGDVDAGVVRVRGVVEAEVDMRRFG